MVFPEGTTFAGDEVHPFHPGAFVAAARSDAQIIPIGNAYQGEAASFMDESFGEHMKRVASARTTRVAMEVGDPIRVGGRSVDDVRADARSKIQALVQRARQSF
jgi:1-acyl-sn-glycerol-3-phosphate acyltransferase